MCVCCFLVYSWARLLSVNFYSCRYDVNYDIIGTTDGDSKIYKLWEITYFYLLLRIILQQVLRSVKATVLFSDNYCVVLNAVKRTAPQLDSGKVLLTFELDKKLLVQGPAYFFLHPGMDMEGGIEDGIKVVRNLLSFVRLNVK